MLSGILLNSVFLVLTGGTAPGSQSQCAEELISIRRFLATPDIDFHYYYLQMPKDNDLNPFTQKTWQDHLGKLTRELALESPEHEVFIRWQKFYYGGNPIDPARLVSEPENLRPLRSRLGAYLRFRRYGYENFTAFQAKFPGAYRAYQLHDREWDDYWRLYLAIDQQIPLTSYPVAGQSDEATPIAFDNELWLPGKDGQIPRALGIFKQLNIGETVQPVLLPENLVKIGPDLRLYQDRIPLAVSLSSKLDKNKETVLKGLVTKFADIRQRMESAKGESPKAVTSSDLLFAQTAVAGIPFFLTPQSELVDDYLRYRRDTLAKPTTYDFGGRKYRAAQFSFTLPQFGDLQFHFTAVDVEKGIVGGHR